MNTNAAIARSYTLASMRFGSQVFPLCHLLHQKSKFDPGTLHKVLHLHLITVTLETALQDIIDSLIIKI
jgi:hypothetical protein